MRTAVALPLLAAMLAVLVVLVPMLTTAMEVPVMVGDQQLTLRLPDDADQVTLEQGIAEMSAAFQKTLAEQLGARVPPKADPPPKEKQPLQVRINVDGNPHVMHISYGADVHAGVAEFAAKLGLTDESKQALTKQAESIAVAQGYLPLFRHPVKLHPNGPALHMPVFAGEHVEQSATKFLAAAGVPADALPDFAAALAADVKLELVGKGLAPLTSFKFATATGGEFSVHIYVGDNLTETVVRQCMERGVSLEDSLQARDYASKQMQAEGLLPIQEYPITIDGQTAPLTVFSGETPEAALSRFVRRFQVPTKHHEELRQMLTRHLVEEGIAPAVTLSVRVDQQTVQLPLFKGVAVDDSVGRFVNKYGLSAESASALRREVSRSLQAKGLAPLIEFSFQVDGKPTKLPLFEGQNVTEQVLRFGDATGIKPDGLAKVFAEVNRGLRSQGLAPLAEFQIQYNGMSLPIQFHQGENLLSVVRAFAGKHGMDEDMLPGLLQQLTSGLVDGGHLPTVQLPVKVGDNSLMLQIFKGQSPQDAVARFLEQTGLSSHLAPKLQSGLVSRMKDNGLLPLSEFIVTHDGRDLSLPLYKGEGVDAAVAAFVKRHGLSEDTVAGLVTEVGRRAAANGDVPFVTVPINVRGEALQLPLYVGMSVSDEVAKFGAQHQVHDTDMPALLQAVQQVLTQAQQQG